VNIEDLVVLNISEESSFINEDLPPIWVGAPDLEFVGLSWVLNVPRLIVQSGLDGQSLLVEVPSLSFSSVSGLKDDVSVIDDIKISSRSHVRDNVEISLNN
jgi:hypothetical protein